MTFGRRALVTFLAMSAFTRLARARPTFKTLTGPFTQIRSIGLLKSTVRSRGVMTIVRPDRLRWELLPPDDIVYFVTPDVIAYRSRQGLVKIPASTGRMAVALEDLRGLFGDVPRLRARYDLTETTRPNGALLEAVPKDPANSPFKKITLELAPDLIRPTRATLVEGARDQTEIVFGDLKIDGPVDPKQMDPT